MTGPENTSVYIGNVPPNCTGSLIYIKSILGNGLILEDDIRQTFKKYGSVLDVRHFKPQGYAFVRYDSKDAAAKAIVDMNGEEFMGQTVRCSWGKTDVFILMRLKHCHKIIIIGFNGIWTTGSTCPI